jgi:putative intracellular protease/amidase
MPSILLALTSHAELGDTGRTTGFYVPEAARAHRVLTSAGYQVDFTSVRGGDPPRDGVKPGDPEVAAFLRDHADALAGTAVPGSLNAADYDAIFYVGGHGAMWDFPDSQELAALAARIYQAGGVIGAVCHGQAGLVNLRLGDDRYLVSERRLTSFTNTEEADIGLSSVVPFSLQDRLTERGAHFTGMPQFTDHTITDERLVTGQNPASAASTATQVVRALARNRGLGPIRRGRHARR